MHDANDGGYGKGFCKRQKCGPDAWIQMALQVAFRRDQVISKPETLHPTPYTLNP